MEEANNQASLEAFGDLQNKLEPLRIVQGLQPFEDDKRTQEPIEQRPAQDRQVQGNLSLSGQSKEHVLFTLAPLYWALSIPFDVVSQFQNTEWGKDAKVLRWTVPFALIKDVPGWEDRIESIDKDHWDRFTLFMGELMFKRKDSYWTVCGDMLTVTKPGTSLSIAVFTPRNMTKRLTPWVDESGVIRFKLDNITSGTDSYTKKFGLFLNKETS